MYANFQHNNVETQLLATGTLLSNQQKFINSDDIGDYEFKIFSQYGDDGIIQFLVNNLTIQNKTFIEFGVENYQESNTRFLLMNNNWSGFIMDGSEAAMESVRKRNWFYKYDLRTKAIFITRDNIKSCINEAGYKDLGLLHVDLDGNDYYILECIVFSALNPSILIVEYNAVFGNERPISVPYDPEFYRTKAHYSNLYFGASLPAFHHFATQKGYVFVGANKAGNNGYFIRKDLLNEKVKSKTIAEGFIQSTFRESRDQHGTLSFLRGNARYELIKGLPVWNVVTQQLEKL